MGQSNKPSGTNERATPEQSATRRDASIGPGTFAPPSSSASSSRRTPHSPAPDPAAPMSVPTIFDRLRSSNAELLNALHTLDAFERSIPRRTRAPAVAHMLGTLIDEASALIADKRWIEEDFVFPLLLEHVATQREALMSREQGRVIGELLSELRTADPFSQDFGQAVAALLEAVQNQIDREEQRLLPEGERVTPEHFARNLARRLDG